MQSNDQSASRHRPHVWTTETACRGLVASGLPAHAANRASSRTAPEPDTGGRRSVAVALAREEAMKISWRLVGSLALSLAVVAAGGPGKVLDLIPGQDEALA